MCADRVPYDAAASAGLTLLGLAAPWAIFSHLGLVFFDDTRAAFALL